MLDGTGLRVEPIATGGLKQEGGRTVIPSSDLTIDDDDVRVLRDAGQR